MLFHCGTKNLDLAKPVVMGIVNLTPDSFAGDGIHDSIEAALLQAHRMVEEGAAILDLGAESTRPGAKKLSDQEECDRLLPVLERVLTELDVVISVDTRKPSVIEAALAAGAHMINSVDGLTTPGALDAVASSNAGVCLMHMRGEPETMQEGLIEYSDVVAEVYAFLHGRVAACEERGIAKNRIAIDPGFGFGKTIEHNSLLLQKLQAFSPLGCPVLFGCSRKSTLGVITGKPVDQRVFASVAGAVLACYHGAKMIRVHDVAATVDALAVLEAIMVAPSIESMDL